MKRSDLLLVKSPSHPPLHETRETKDASTLLSDALINWYGTRVAQSFQQILIPSGYRFQPPSYCLVPSHTSRPDPRLGLKRTTAPPSSRPYALLCVPTQTAGGSQSFDILVGGKSSWKKALTTVASWSMLPHAWDLCGEVDMPVPLPLSREQVWGVLSIDPPVTRPSCLWHGTRGKVTMLVPLSLSRAQAWVALLIVLPSKDPQPLVVLVSKQVASAVGPRSSAESPVPRHHCKGCAAWSAL